MKFFNKKRAKKQPAEVEESLEVAETSELVKPQESEEISNEELLSSLASIQSKINATQDVVVPKPKAPVPAPAPAPAPALTPQPEEQVMSFEDLVNAKRDSARAQQAPAQERRQPPAEGQGMKQPRPTGQPQRAQAPRTSNQPGKAPAQAQARRSGEPIRRRLPITETPGAGQPENGPAQGNSGQPVEKQARAMGMKHPGAPTPGAQPAPRQNIQHSNTADAGNDAEMGRHEANADHDNRIVEVPAPAAGRAGRRAGRVKTRLLGFEQSHGVADDPFDESKAVKSQVQANFPVGWIVIVEGPGRGTSFSLFDGVSHMGRGEDQAIKLDYGDNSISRSNHAAVAYDSESRTFFLGHGGKANLVRLNGKPVLSTEEMSNRDLIRIGETTLRFVGLCGKNFDWSSDNQEEQEEQVNAAIA